MLELPERALNVLALDLKDSSSLTVRSRSWLLSLPSLTGACVAQSKSAPAPVEGGGGGRRGCDAADAPHPM